MSGEKKKKKTNNNNNKIKLISINLKYNIKILRIKAIKIYKA